MLGHVQTPEISCPAAAPLISYLIPGHAENARSRSFSLQNCITLYTLCLTGLFWETMKPSSVHLSLSPHNSMKRYCNMDHTFSSAAYSTSMFIHSSISFCIESRPGYLHFPQWSHSPGQGMKKGLHWPQEAPDRFHSCPPSLTEKSPHKAELSLKILNSGESVAFLLTP